METSFFSDIGLVRPNNEDSWGGIPPWREPALSSGTCLFVIADGMGGHSKGEVASRMAVTGIERWFTKHYSEAFSLDALETAISETNSEIFHKASETPEQNGMGTTLTALLMKGDQGIIGHVGDSRGYLVRNNVLKQITRDHTLVGEQVRLGKLSPEEARRHPTRHILTRAVGVREFVMVDSTMLELAKDDIFLLCSDGIYGLLNDEEILATLLEVPATSAAKSLVNKANKAGGTDNSTALVVKVQEVPLVFPHPFSFRRIHATWKDWWNHSRR